MKSKANEIYLDGNLELVYHLPTQTRNTLTGQRSIVDLACMKPEHNSLGWLVVFGEIRTLAIVMSRLMLMMATLVLV